MYECRHNIGRFTNELLEHSRLNCEDNEVVFDSDAFMSQLEEGGGGTDAPRPGSLPMEVLLP